MMVWVNEVNFIDLYNWMILMGEQGGEIEKMNVRKSKKDKVNAQIFAHVAARLKLHISGTRQVLSLIHI